MRSSILAGLLQAKAAWATQCASESDYSSRCGMIDGVHVTCGPHRCCSFYGSCGSDGQPTKLLAQNLNAQWHAYCDPINGGQPDFSHNNCNGADAPVIDITTTTTPRPLVSASSCPAPSGQYYETCSSCDTTQGPTREMQNLGPHDCTISCLCRAIDGSWHHSSASLTTGIDLGNDDGLLRCYRGQQPYVCPSPDLSSGGNGGNRGPARVPATALVFNLTVLEEFSVDYNLVRWEIGQSDGFEITTHSPGPSDAADYGSIAFHARNLQLKLDNHVVFPPTADFGGNPLLTPLVGTEVREELHINGATGQASFHLSSNVLSMCVLADHLPPMAQIEHAQIEQALQQAEQIATMIFQQRGCSATVDGTQGEYISQGSAADCEFEYNDQSSRVRFQIQASGMVFSTSSQPKFIAFNGPNAVILTGFKFSNYSSSVDNQFSVRACEVEAHIATQNLMAANPEAREFIANRVAEHQMRLQALLQLSSLNTRFNFIPLNLVEMLMAPAEQGCAQELGQIRSKAASPFQTAVLGACSFVMGISATFGMLRRRSVAPADAYHQVLA